MISRPTTRMTAQRWMWPVSGRLMATTAVSKGGQMVHFWSIHGMPTFRVPLRCLPAGSVVLLLARHTPCYHGSVPGKQEDKGRTATSRKGYTQSSRRSTPWRELTSYFLLRPRGASLLAQTGRSEQGDVRSQSRWPRLDPPTPSFHRTHALRRTTCGMAAASRGSHDRGRVKLSRTASKPA